ncbi:ubiquitin carboxyl-terminal hydrolase 29-like isoform X3 [Photinus pyralis]|uniref:ubiquitin carboxyl-terminal hydrolase 29-like isoform X3 n=1 Tax=Photinus pyralis TaxID=7054 RepID=UPI0012670CE2|nr:ubiquitin carboxyl-terminal hydrolase 29-like isoform X3 [Photinus pyralis]
MPVLSPRRSSASPLTGTYRSTSSTIDRPFYNSTSNSYVPRISSYSERYTTRSYIDSDGRKVISRQGSITEDGITTRFKEETRESSVRRDSISRDSGISSLRDSSLTRTDPRVSAISVAESVAEMRNKYSPSNYVPACLRNVDNISRSKSINDIGKPPLEREKATKYKVNDGLSYSNGLGVTNSNNTNSLEKMCDNVLSLNEDDNGNRTASVAEIRKKFDQSNLHKTSKNDLTIEGIGVKISENRFKKQDSLDKHKIKNGSPKMGDEKRPAKLSKLEVHERSAMDDSADLSNFDKCLAADLTKGTKLNQFTSDTENGHENSDVLVDDGYRNFNHTSNFASYIPSMSVNQGNGDFVKDEISIDEGNDMENRNLRNENSRYHKAKVNDLTTSPRLNRALSQSTTLPSTSNSIAGSNNYHRNSLEREGRNSPVAVLGLNGLKNIGNTCFMNSVIQCLSNTRLLLEYVKNDGYSSDINTSISSMKGALIKAFSQVIKELWSDEASDRVVNTLTLKSQIQRFAPRFMGYSQQDAQEFLRYLLEGLHEDVNRVTTKPAPILTEIDEKLSDGEKAYESWQRYLRMDNSKVVDIFVGQLKSTLKCTHCGHCSVTFDPFWDLSLSIPQRPSGSLRLQQCLDHFTREETLDGDEKPVGTCSKCKERRKCTKSFTIQKFPKILVIHLKRFSPTERFRGKLSSTIDFPLENLDLRNYAADNSPSECRYNLYAISNHSGTTYSGHYTAYCRHPYSQTWHEYNDSRVSSISPKMLVSGEAYVLFYELDSQKSRL